MKKFRLKGVYILTSLALLIMLQISLAYSGSGNAAKAKITTYAPLEIATPATSASSALLAVYDSLNLEAKGLSEEAFNYAIRGFEQLKAKGRLVNQKIISIVDFTKPSSSKRLFVIDLERTKILFNTYVAHGQNTGQEWARKFSNKHESYQSSLGFYVTSGTYMGKNGFSMQLAGQEAGFNDNAGERAIVMHGAPYVSEGFIRARGYIGRSHGCPAVPEQLNKPIINTIKNGSCLFIYSNDKNYINRSRLLNT